MKNLLNPKIITGAALFFASTMILASCNDPSSPTPSSESAKTYDVTYYNGDTVLKTEKVEEGKKATEWTPVVEGYDFKGWYGTPTFTHKFDFNTAITSNTSVFGMFVSNEYIADTRDFFIVGSGTSPVLLESNWGKVINESTMKLAKADDKNEYTITLDLFAGDQFQFAIDSSWSNQRGVGYLEEFELNGEEIFKNPGSAYGNDSRRSNIEVKKSGNYTLTLITHPTEDYYDTDNPNYTEAGKENFNLNDYDKITWVRNGDVSEVQEVVMSYYVKGSGVTKWTDIYNNHTKMVDNNGTHSLSIYMKQGEEFLFTSLATVGETVTTGTEYLRYSNLDEASKALFDAAASYNLIAKASGNYTFSYVEETKVLSATFVAASMTPTDFYIDGTFGNETNWQGYCFKEAYKLVKEEDKDIYKISNVSMKKDSEFIIQAFKAGATERGEWGTEGYNGLGSYNYNYLTANEDFSAVSDTNKNIKVLRAASYDVELDAYAQIITVTEHVDDIVYDIYIKGGMNSWNHNFDAQWKLTRNSENKDIYEISLAFEVDWEVGLARYNEGETTGYGEWIGKDKLGTSGNANDAFRVESGYNLKCNQAGTYRVTYSVSTDKLDFYTVA